MLNKTFILIASFPLIFLLSYGFSEQENSGETDQFESERYIHEPIFDGDVYIYESGKNFKTSVMLVHGIGEDASNIWNNLVPLLEKQYHVIYFDLPGFGRSGKENALYSPKNYALFIKWVYDRFVDSPMNLIGHSMGASISLYYAGTYPGTVERLILVDAAGILHGAAITENLAKVKITGSGELSLFKDQIDSLNNYIDSVIEATSRMMPKDISMILNNPFLRKVVFAEPKEIAGAALINTDFSKQIDNVKAQSFIIWGGSDPIAPIRTGRMLAWNIPYARLSVMKGLGHSPMTEDPSGFNDLIIKSLSDELNIPENKQRAINKKTLSLDKKEGLIIEGEYDTIKINNCKNIQIINTNAKSIIVNNSWIEIENTVVKSDNTGIKLSDSVLAVTGGSVSGNVAISTSNSRLDLAGVKIEGKKAAIMSGSDYSSSLVFSVCKIKSPYNNRHIHDIMKIEKDTRL